MAFLKQVPPEGELRSTYFGKLYCEVTQCNGKKIIVVFSQCYPVGIGWVLDGYHEKTSCEISRNETSAGVGISLSKMSQNPRSVDYFPSSV
jgi:hypothetical protein